MAGNFNDIRLEKYVSVWKTGVWYDMPIRWAPPNETHWHFPFMGIYHSINYNPIAEFGPLFKTAECCCLFHYSNVIYAPMLTT